MSYIPSYLIANDKHGLIPYYIKILNLAAVSRHTVTHMPFLSPPTPVKNIPKLKETKLAAIRHAVPVAISRQGNDGVSITCNCLWLLFLMTS